MENKKLTEQESLALIAEMIRQSKRNMEVGRGNLFLLYGYFTPALSVALYLLISCTGHAAWSWGWLAMFAVWPLCAAFDRRNPPEVVTYTDKCIKNVWHIMGALFFVSFLCLSAFAFWLPTDMTVMAIMLPLSLLYAAIGVSITGIVLEERWITLLPLTGVCLALYMLTGLFSGAGPLLEWYLWFGVSFIAMMAVPGHILNRKPAKSC